MNGDGNCRELNESFSTCTFIRLFRCSQSKNSPCHTINLNQAHVRHILDRLLELSNLLCDTRHPYLCASPDNSRDCFGSDIIRETTLRKRLSQLLVNWLQDRGAAGLHASKGSGTDTNNKCDLCEKGQVAESCVGCQLVGRALQGHYIVLLLAPLGQLALADSSLLRGDVFARLVGLERGFTSRRELTHCLDNLALRRRQGAQFQSLGKREEEL